jgi:hypothetical protein
MGIVSEAPYRSENGSVRVLTTPEDLAEALARVEDFERRTALLVASREERHDAALARTPWDSARRDVGVRLEVS